MIVSSRLVSSRLVSSRLVFAYMTLSACSVDESAVSSDDTTTGPGGVADSTGGSGSTGDPPPPVVCEENAGAFDALLDWSEAANAGIAVNFVATHVVHAPPVIGDDLARDPSTARLLVMGGLNDQHFWDPLTGEFATDGALRLDNVNLFCAGHSITPEGNLFFVGGGGGNASLALSSTYRLDHVVADSGSWQPLAGMAYPRWYPTVTSLGDGRMLVFGGSVDGACSDRLSVGTCEASPTCNWDWNSTRCVLDPDSDYESVARRTPEIFDPSDGVSGTWTTLPASEFVPPLYPFMFLLPDGNVFYAGGDAGTVEQDEEFQFTEGRVLVLDGPAPVWAQTRYQAGIAGGSAVMYGPGKIMKSGGGAAPTSRTVFIDLSPTDANGNDVADYLESDRAWTELPEHIGDMHEPRHFHQLTILPDGRVAATGGNWYLNDRTGDSANNLCSTTTPCDTVPREINQIVCGGMNPACPCGLECSNDAADHDGDPETDPVRTCWPGNNACYATKTAEIWDPETHQWSPCADTFPAAEAKPRMYHSTATLLRDGGVISMGGGKQRAGLEEQYNAQVFRPPYGNGGTAPTITLNTQSVSYGSTIDVEHTNSPAVSIAGFSLVRLGSVTHSFDMEQRFVPLDPMPPAGNRWSIAAPASPNLAPAGWYLLFAIGGNGVPSQGEYIQLTDETTIEWVCAPGSGLSITERGCLPGAGPTCGSNSNSVPLLAPSLGGSLRGWAVHTPPARIEDAAAPSPTEVALVRSLCKNACEIEWQNEPGVTATCGAGSAFATPTARAVTSPSVLATVTDAYAYGQGIFPSTTLSCELESSCCTAFDEAVCAAVAERPTPSAIVVGRGEAYRVPWKTSTSTLAIITNQGTWTRTLTGSAGFSPCRDGNASGACPFYLGSLTAATTSAITPTALCSDGTTSPFPLSAVSFELEQPSIGVARQSTTERGFPPGGLVFEARVTTGGQTFARRQVTNTTVKGTQNGGSLALTNIDSTLTLPCGSGTTTVTARLNLNSNPATGSPPIASITVPSQVTCGAARALTATVSDPNNDLVSTRWLVDGVLLASSVTSVTFTGTHELAVRARDARGATTTTKKVISCL